MPRSPEALGAGHHVLEHRQALEQADALQRAGDSERGEAIGPDPSQRPAAPLQRPRVGSDEAADQVEQRRLAGAVGADHADDLARSDLERHAVERGDPAEANRRIAHLQAGGGLRGLHARKLYQRQVRRQTAAAGGQEFLMTIPFDDVGHALGRVDRRLQALEQVLPADHDHRIDARRRTATRPPRG